jgi:hypothetical protein
LEDRYRSVSFGQAIQGTLTYACIQLNLDLDEATCAVPYNGREGWSFDPFGQFIEQIQSRN